MGCFLWVFFQTLTIVMPRPILLWVLKVPNAANRVTKIFLYNNKAHSESFTWKSAIIIVLCGGVKNYFLLRRIQNPS